jgi:sorbose reductase
MSMTLDEVQVTREGFPRPTPDTPSNVMEQFRMDGRVVVVNGASSGIGLAVSEGFAEAKANVVMWYNSNDTAIQKAEEFSKTHGIKAKAYKVNVTDAEAVQKAIAQVVEDFGKLDVFVANAG